MIETASRTGAILGLENARIPGADPSRATATRVDQQLRPGGLCLIQPRQALDYHLLLDACCGLHPVESGRVLFLGRSWELLKAEDANALRGLIGRVFADPRWVSHLSLADNLMLAQRHHATFSQSRIRRECHDRSLFFGLPGIPMGRPDQAMGTDLVRAGCVRAFVGKPYLVLIEDLPPNALTPVFTGLINAIREVRERGGAVLWVTTSREVWEEPCLDPDQRMQMAWNEVKEVA